MAKIEVLMPFLLGWEGGFVDNKYDLGGATCKGVTMKTFKLWRARKGRAEPTLEDLKNITDEEVMEITKEEFWDKCKGDDILCQDIANLLVDWRYNSGIYAVRWIQRILGVADDGILGPITLKKINDSNWVWLFDRLKEERKAFLHRIVEAKPTQKRFIKGWIRRTDSIEPGSLVWDLGSMKLKNNGTWEFSGKVR